MRLLSCLELVIEEHVVATRISFYSLYYTWSFVSFYSGNRFSKLTQTYT